MYVGFWGTVGSLAVFHVLVCQRCAIVSWAKVDAATGQLWSKVAEGTSEIRLPLGRGIAGHVASSGEVVNVAGARFIVTVL